MSFGIGVLFAAGAMLFWGLGDFMIQKTTRHVGDWETLFLISAGGTVMLTPFVYSDIASYLAVPQTLLTLLVASVVIFAAALIDFEALKKGKICAVEPVLSLEVPIAAILSLMIVNEALSPVEILLMVMLMVGLVLVSIKSHHLSKKAWIERGVIFAAIAATLLGITDVLVGFGARATAPIVVNWVINITLTVFTLTYILLKRGGVRKLVRDTLKVPLLAATTCTFDNLAWISYAFATVLMPIPIAVAISETFIAFAALLGLFVNKEKLMLHQKIGLALSLFGAIALAAMV